MAIIPSKVLCSSIYANDNEEQAHKAQQYVDMVVSYLCGEVQWVENLNTLLADHPLNDGRGMFWKPQHCKKKIGLPLTKSYLIHSWGGPLGATH